MGDAAKGKSGCSGLSGLSGPAAENRYNAQLRRHAAPSCYLRTPCTWTLNLFL